MIFENCSIPSGNLTACYGKAASFFWEIIDTRSVFLAKGFRWDFPRGKGLASGKHTKKAIENGHL